MDVTEAIFNLVAIEGFTEVFGVLCAVFVLVGAWLSTRETKLLPTLVALSLVMLGQEVLRYMYFRSVSQIYLLSPVVSAITLSAALTMMSVGYVVSSRPEPNTLVVRGEFAHTVSQIKEAMENGLANGTAGGGTTKEAEEAEQAKRAPEARGG